MVSGAARNGMTLIAVAMRADAGQVCQDHINMFDYGFNNFQKVEVPGGAVTIPQNAQIEDLTTTESEEVRETYYFNQNYFVGTGTKSEEIQQETEEPETLTPEVTQEPQKGQVKETAENSGDEEKETYKLIIDILIGLIGMTVIIMIISVVRKKRKRKKRKRGRK